jgi:hypothetical protein
VLQGSEIVENGSIKATWCVVLSFPDQAHAIFPYCAARAGWKVTLEKGPTNGWIIGSNDVATVRSPFRRAETGIPVGRVPLSRSNL